MKKYFILNWVLQMAIIAVMFFVAECVVGEFTVDHISPIIMVSIVFGSGATAVSNLVMMLWLKHDDVYIIDKYTEIKLC